MPARVSGLSNPYPLRYRDHNYDIFAQFKGVGRCPAAGRALEALAAGDYSKESLAAYAVDLHRHIGRHHTVFRFLQKLVGWPWVTNRLVQRARHDRVFAQTLFEAIIEMRPPADLLKPGFMGRWLMG